MSTALVPLQSKKRFTFRFSGSSWIIFDNARCCFIFPEWMDCPNGFIFRDKVTTQTERSFEEVQRARQEFDRWMEKCSRIFAAGYGIPYDFLIAPIPKTHEEEL